MLGMEEALPDTISTGFFELGEDSYTNYFLRRLRNSWDMVNYRWNVWVLSYNDERQLQLLKRIGIKEFDLNALVTLIVGLFLGLIITLLFIAWFLFRNSIIHADPAAKYYYLFCNKLSKLGITKLNHEGPYDFSNRIKEKMPELANTIDEIILMYINIRYNSDETYLASFKQKVNAFKPNLPLKSL